MSYATVEDLASALEIRVTDENTPSLEACLDAAAAEIDRILVDVDPDSGFDPTTNAIVARTNINRAVEWWKAPATYNGGVGSLDTGNMTAPTSGFGRHAAVLYALTDTGTSGVA